MAAANKIITPHAEIASLFPPQKRELLAWNVPNVSPAFKRQPQNGTICFPGPTVARKGGYELRTVARQLDCEILLCGSELEGDGFWSGVRTRRANSFQDALRTCDIVVLPALVEDCPRRLLAALACDIPFIATSHCGLARHDKLTIVPFGDETALREAVAPMLSIPKYTYASN